MTIWRPDSSVTVTFDSVADFRSSTNIPAAAVKIIIKGRTAPNTPGGGVYLIDLADTTTADNNGSVLINSDGLRIKLFPVVNYFKTSHYGLVADGTNQFPRWANLLTEAVSAAGEAVIEFDVPGVYIIRASPTNYNIPHLKKITIKGVGGVTIQGSRYLLSHFPGSTVTTLSSDVNKFDQTLNLPFSPETGEVIELLCHRSSATGTDIESSSFLLYRQSFQVAKDEDNTVNISGSKFFFPSSLFTLPDGVTTVVTSVQRITKVPIIRIENLNLVYELQGDNNSANLSRFFEFHPAYLSIHNVTFSTDRPPTASEKGDYFNLPGIVLNKLGSTNCEQVIARNSGYTIWLQYGQKSTIKNCHASFTRHFLTQNNQHDVTVINCSSTNGGFIDGHGYWDLTIKNCNFSDSFALNNARGLGNLTIKDSSINGPLVTGAANAYATGSWVNSTNEAFFRDNFSGELYIENSVITGLLKIGPHFSNVHIKKTKLGEFSPSEISYGTALGIERLTFLEEVRYTNGNKIYYPNDLTLPVRDSRVINYSNPENYIEPLFVDASVSGSGFDTYIFPLDSYQISMEKSQYSWKSSRSFYKNHATGTSITLVFLFHVTGWPQLGPQVNNNERLLTLTALSTFRHQSALDAVEHHEDTAIIRYRPFDPLTTIEKNFTTTKSGRSFIPATISAVRNPSSAVQILPAELSEWGSLFQSEIDLDLLSYPGVKTNGTIGLSLNGHCRFCQ